jgi:stage V sporulation protein R
MNTNLLYSNNEWTFQLLKEVDTEIAKIARDELRLNTYPNQMEIISSDQMLDAYSSHGLPLMYEHWSFGKNFIRQSQSYRKGYTGLAYEIVINTDPVISYLMEENSMTMQALVIAHAAYGHNHFFKNNYLFREWTDADAIIDYLSFAKNYIAKCEERYGIEETERTLDAAHSLMNFGIDRYRRPSKLNKEKRKKKEEERAEILLSQTNLVYDSLINKKHHLDDESIKIPSEPQENILYFLEKNSPCLQTWQREILRIVRKISQYFSPQIQTKVMNEGWASFVHYYIMNRLWEKNMISDGNLLEVLHVHSSVLAQPDFDNKYYSGFNPYALGFDMFMDIKRICENPTKEDNDYFPELVGKNWLDVCLDAVENYRDESFIKQFLSPHLIRKWKMFELVDEENQKEYSVSSIHDRAGYSNIKNSLAQQYSFSQRYPDIQVIDADMLNTRTLTLQYFPYNGMKLKKNIETVLPYIRHLWGFDVKII